MKYFLTHQRHQVTLRIRGALDAFWSPDLVSVLDKLVDEPREVIVDLSALRLLDSVGVHALRAFHTRVSARHHSLRFRGVAAQPLFLLKLLRLDALFGLPAAGRRSSRTHGPPRAP